MVRNPRPRPRPRPRPMASKKDVLYCPFCGEEITAKKKMHKFCISGEK